MILLSDWPTFPTEFQVVPPRSMVRAARRVLRAFFVHSRLHSHLFASILSSRRSGPTEHKFQLPDSLSELVEMIAGDQAMIMAPRQVSPQRDPRNRKRLDLRTAQNKHAGRLLVIEDCNHASERREWPLLKAVPWLCIYSFNHVFVHRSLDVDGDAALVADSG